MNWVPVARHGLILWENEATGSRKVSRYLPGLWDAIFLSKMSAEIQKSEHKIVFSVYLHTPDQPPQRPLCYQYSFTRFVHTTSVRWIDPRHPEGSYQKI